MRTVLGVAVVVASLAACGDGRYQIAGRGDSAGVWRLDTRSGEVAHCVLLVEGAVRCAPFVK